MIPEDRIPVLTYDKTVPQVQFAIEKIREALNSKGLNGETLNGAGSIAISIEEDPSKPESFAIAKTGRGDVTIVGSDAAGAMYGGLELAEQISIGGFNVIEETEQSPYMPMRGTKFNIPLDVRSPSYSDPCDAAQNNIEEMWSLEFWKEYIDELASHRYNYISLWNLHPFPSMVRVPDYPDVALDDVKRSLTIRNKELYTLQGTFFDIPEVMDSLETLKVMTIDEKIDFWKQVMDYGKQRNVAFYIMTWNIFINGTDGKYGITDCYTNEITKDYFRKSVEQMLLTYPDLAGIGITTGENMREASTVVYNPNNVSSEIEYGKVKDASYEEKGQWMFDTYGKGILDALSRQPERKFRFIHRKWMAGPADVAETFGPLIANENVDFIFSCKYAQAHVYSSTVQPWHNDFVENMGDLKTVWTLRNDDVYHFRWGAPDFVREFILNIPYDVSQGYYYGSDGYIWGREFLSLEPGDRRQLELDKHWYQWMLWGRLGYDPKAPNSRFEDIVGTHFPGIDKKALFDSWQHASMIYPITTGFHWGSLDFQWYIEACKSRPQNAFTPTGFHDVNRFISLGTHRGTGYLSIPDFVTAEENDEETEGKTPLDISEMLHHHADTALLLLDKLHHGGDKELRHTLDDIRSIAYLGKYYAHKITGATELHRKRLQYSAQELSLAAEYWRRYASISLGQYKNPLWTNRVGFCDWREIYESVLGDIRIAGGRQTHRSIDHTPGGLVVENQGRDRYSFEVQQGGKYVLEIRYAMDGGMSEQTLLCNDKQQGHFTFWNTGGSETFACDRKTIELVRGENQIDMDEGETVRIASINLIATEY